MDRLFCEQECDLLAHIEDSIRSKEFEMADFIRVSYASLSVIPEERRYLMHSMYEDSDVDGANDAEAVFDFIERVAPGTFVLVLCNDSVTPPCCNRQGHFHCDHYAPYWCCVLLLASTWEQYESRVKAAHQAWIDSRQCKVVEV